MFNWEDGKLIEPAYIEIDGQRHYVTPAKYEGSTPISSSNLNKMQKYIKGDIKDIGTLEITDGIDPNTYLEGTWEKQKMFLGGELIAFGNVRSQGSQGTGITDGKVFSIADNVINNKTSNVTNYIDDILTYRYGTLWCKPKNVVGMIEAELCICGNIGANCTGLWFKNNQNELLEGVSMEAGEGALNSIYGSYGGTINKYVYKVDENKEFADADGFFINPGVAPYGGVFIPCSGGVKCYLTVKVFAKKGMTIWKRIS